MFFVGRPLLVIPCGQLDYEFYVIGLNGCVLRCAAAALLAALLTAVDYYVSSARIGLGTNGTELASAFICSVAGVLVDVKRPKAKRAVIPRGIAQRLYFFAAMGANKARIVLFEAFCFHFFTDKICRFCTLGHAPVGKRASISFI